MKQHDWVYYALVGYASITALPVLCLIGMVLHDLVNGWSRRRLERRERAYLRSVANDPKDAA